MDFSQQLPIVIHSLNIGFLQTLRLFVITLIGACPLGLATCFGSMSRIKPVSAFFKLLIWVVRGTPLMIQLLIIYFSRDWYYITQSGAAGETGRFLAASVFLHFELCLLLFRNLPRWYSKCTGRSGRSRIGSGHEPNPRFSSV